MRGLTLNEKLTLSLQRRRGKKGGAFPIRLYEDEQNYLFKKAKKEHVSVSEVVRTIIDIFMLEEEDEK